MAAPRKRTARKTTSTRRQTPAKSGRNSTSFIAIGILAGLAIAILFYSMVIRQDANLNKGSSPQYAHTPSQTEVLTPLPPRPRDEATTSASTETERPAAAPQSTETRRSIAEATADRPAPAATERTPEASVAKRPSTPSTTTTTTAPTAPAQSPKTEDPIAQLIARTEAQSKAEAAKPAQTTPPRQATKQSEDHVGALISTLPATQATKSASNTTNTIRTEGQKNIDVVPNKAIALAPTPSKDRPFYLQAGPFNNEQEADAMRAQLLLLGHSNPSIHKALVNNKTVYRVRIGPYTSSEALTTAQKSVQDAKLNLKAVH